MPPGACRPLYKYREDGRCATPDDVSSRFQHLSSHDSFFIFVFIPEMAKLASILCADRGIKQVCHCETSASRRSLFCGALWFLSEKMFSRIVFINFWFAKVMLRRWINVNTNRIILPSIWMGQNSVRSVYWLKFTSLRFCKSLIRRFSHILSNSYTHKLKTLPWSNGIKEILN